MHATGSTPRILGFAEALSVAQARMFFVVGAPRSGTTWVQRALDGHPEISCFGEAHFFEELAPRLAGAVTAYGDVVRARSKASLGDEQAFLPLADAESLLALAVLLAMQRNARPGARWIGEKTPDNVLALGRLWQLFPDAQVVHVHRDPRDVCVSAWFNNLRLNRPQTLERWPDLASYAATQARAWGARIGAARRFAAARPEQYHEVSYEALTGDFDSAFAGVLRFLGAAADAEILAGCRQAGSFQAAAGRPVGTEDANSHFRRGETGNWRAHFDAALGRRYAEIAGAEMRLLGYDPG